MTSTPPGRRESRERFPVTPRAVIGIVIAVLLVIFIVMNREKTSISFIFFDAQAALWVALALAAGAGFVTGFLVSRKRYR